MTPSPPYALNVLVTFNLRGEGSHFGGSDYAQHDTFRGRLCSEYAQHGSDYEGSDAQHGNDYVSENAQHNTFGGRCTVTTYSTAVSTYISLLSGVFV